MISGEGRNSNQTFSSDEENLNVYKHILTLFLDAISPYIESIIKHKRYLCQKYKEKHLIKIGSNKWVRNIRR